MPLFGKWVGCVPLPIWFATLSLQVLRPSSKMFLAVEFEDFVPWRGSSWIIFTTTFQQCEVTKHFQGVMVVG